MGNSEPIQKEVSAALQTCSKFEQIADLAEVKGMQNDVIGLLGTIMPFYFGQYHEEQHYGGEDISKDLHVAESVIHVCGHYELPGRLGGDLRGVDVRADCVSLD